MTPLAPAEPKRRTRGPVFAVAAVLAVGAAVTMWLWPTTAGAQSLDLRVDTSHSTYPTGWQVMLHYWRNFDHETVEAGTRSRSTLGAGSTVFHLDKQGRYFLRAWVAPVHGLLNTSCAKDVQVGSETRSVATIHLFGKDRQCTWTVSRRSQHPRS